MDATQGEAALAGWIHRTSLKLLDRSPECRSGLEDRKSSSGPRELGIVVRMRNQLEICLKERMLEFHAYIRPCNPTNFPLPWHGLVVGEQNFVVHLERPVCQSNGATLGRQIIERPFQRAMIRSTQFGCSFSLSWRDRRSLRYSPKHSRRRSKTRLGHCATRSARTLAGALRGKVVILVFSITAVIGLLLRPSAPQRAGGGAHRTITQTRRSPRHASATCNADQFVALKPGQMPCPGASLFDQACGQGQSALRDLGALRMVRSRHRVVRWQVPALAVLLRR